MTFPTQRCESWAFASDDTEDATSEPALRSVCLRVDVQARTGRVVFRVCISAWSQPLKVGIVSDLHCNPQGLELALQAMGDVDELLCLGDSIYEYQFSNDVVARLRQRRAHIIQGNHEEVFMSSAGARARERAGIAPDLLKFLSEQPHRRYLDLGGKRLLLIHSTPWEPRGEYIHPHSTKLDRFANADADIVLYGHTHCQVVKRIGNVLIINPGSAGDARDSRNNRQLSCAVLDLVSEEVRVIDYPDPRYGTPA
jgi:putative phosphoesterase